MATKTPTRSSFLSRIRPTLRRSSQKRTDDPNALRETAKRAEDEALQLFEDAISGVACSPSPQDSDGSLGEDEGSGSNPETPVPSKAPHPKSFTNTVSGAVGEAQTLHVGKRSGLSLQNAIDVSSPGDTIVVAAGTYPGPVVVDKDVEIRAEKRHAVCVTGSGEQPVFLCKSKCTLDGLEIIYTGKEKGCIGVVKGCAHVRDCALTSTGPFAVQVQGADASPYFFRNEVHHTPKTKGRGIEVIDGAKGIIDGNTINSEAAAVFLSDTSDVSIVRNKLHGAKSEGAVTVTSRARCTIQDNDITNCIVGVLVAEGADPEVTTNRLHRCDTGVLVTSDACGTFTTNEIIGSASAGIEVTGDAAPTFSANVVRGCKKVGVLLGSGCRAAIEDNTIVQSGKDGVVVLDGARPTVERNTITDNRGVGLVVGEGAAGIVTQNLIEKNAKGNLTAPLNGAIDLSDNSIADA